MECGKIQRMLTPYLEGAVTPEQGLLVESHLSSCEECRCAMEDLRKTGALVKDLEEIEPPPWLAQKIMARVREEAGSKSGVMRWLFYPLHVKLPLEAFATILIVGMAAFLYKVNAPQFEAAKMVPETGRVLHQDDSAPTLEAEQRSAVPSAEDRRWAKDAQAKREEAALEAARQFSTKEKRLTHEERSAASQGSAALSRRQDSPAQLEESQPPYAPVAPLLMPDQRGAAAPQEGIVRSYPMAKAPAPGSVTGIKSERLSLKVRVADFADAAKKIEKLLGEAGAHQVTRESRGGRESISAELKGEKVNDLLQKLSAVGDTRGSASDIQAGETVAIRIDLLETVVGDEGMR